MKQKAFTLAEVLITLGVIGIVTAMTLPTLIQSNKNVEVEAKLKKFYSIMNQAILLSEIDNGPYKLWPTPCNGSSNCEAYLEKYIKPYFTTIKLTKFNSYGGNNITYYFSDGTCAVFKAEGEKFDVFFFPNAKNLNTATFAEIASDGSLAAREHCGVSYFTFQTIPPTYTGKHFRNKKFEPYINGLPGWGKDFLTNDGRFGCNKDSKIRAWCTAFIYYNGWKITEDYPFKVK